MANPFELAAKTIQRSVMPSNSVQQGIESGFNSALKMQADYFKAYDFKVPEMAASSRMTPTQAANFATEKLVEATNRNATLTRSASITAGLGVASLTIEKNLETGFKQLFSQSG